MTLEVCDTSSRQRSRSRHVPAGLVVVRTMNEISNKGRLGRVRADSGVSAGEWDASVCVIKSNCSNCYEVLS